MPKVKFWICLCLSLSLFTACSEDEDIVDTIGTPSTGDGGGPGSQVPVGTIDQTGFWIDVDDGGQYNKLLYKTTSLEEDCIIEADTSGFEFITCYLDIVEGPLYLNDLELRYNSPPGLCDIITVSPAWHYNQDVGFGPSVVNINIDDSDPDVPAFVDSCTATHENDVDSPIACALHPELTDIGSTTGPSCVYDRSGSDGKFNCCFGDYTLNITTTSGALPSSEETNWGGSPQSCISPYLSSWPFDNDGYPQSTIERVPRDPNDEAVGLTNSVSLAANASSNQVRFSTWANFYTVSGGPHGHSGFYGATVSNLPYAIEPIDDLTGTPIRSGNEAWTIGCYDEGLELQNSITLYIREWNTLADFIAYETSGGSSGDPDVVGTQGIDCKLEGPVTGGPCNDYLDLDDILTRAGGSYPTVPGVNDADRENYFPQIEY